MKKSCKKGKDCEYSHDQKVFDKNKKGGGNRSRNQSPRSKSPANKPKKIIEPCWNWAKGKCKYGDSWRRRHDLHLYNTVPNTDVPATPALVGCFDSDDEISVTFNAASTTKRKTVRFNMKDIKAIEYVKDDFVECSRRAPRAKMHSKKGKTSEDLKKDEQLAYSNRLASVRAKGMAIIMSEAGEYAGINEVYIVIGPKVDVKIKMIEDMDDIVDEQVFAEDYIQHVPGKYGAKGNVMCITVPVEERDRKFIMDSGSGHDLIASRKADRMDMDLYDDEMINFHAANGVTSSSKMASIEFWCI